jgi:DNA-binding transcriptional ArsR family regulator
MQVQRQAALFHALGDPTRRALFERLTQGEAPVSALVERSAVSQPAVSQHLKVLRRCGLVADRREGRSRVYRARPEGLAPLTDWLGHYRAFWPERLEKLSSVLKEMDDGERQ